MRSQDWQDMDNVRNQAISQLAEICAAMGLSWSATEGKFMIELPHIIAVKGAATLVIDDLPTQRKTFDISKWGGNSGIYEGEAMPDDMQMPDYGEILEEGEAPKGDPNEEK